MIERGKWFWVLLCVMFLATTVHCATSTLTGTITDAQGNPLNGQLVMQLPVPAQDPTTGRAIAPTPVYFRLSNGAITGGAPIYDVNTINPHGLYYIAKAFDSAGNLAFYGNYVVTGATFNLGQAVPTIVTTSNISYLPLPAVGGTTGQTQSNNGANSLAGEANRVYADQFPGADWSAKLQAAIGASAAGAVIDGTAFSTSQLATTQTVLITPGQGQTLLLPCAVIPWSSGIAITASGITVQGCGSTPYGSPAVSQTVMKATTANPIIYDYNGTLHVTDGLVVRNLSFDGNQIGTFAIFAPNHYNSKYENLIAHDFVGAGFLDLGGQASWNYVYAWSNGPRTSEGGTCTSTSGDGFVLGFDITGMTNVNAGGNCGDNYHFLSGGNNGLVGLVSYQAGLNGINVDGEIAGDWLSAHTYIEPKLIVPTSNNAGQYAFYTQTVGTTTVGLRPTFCQSVGCTTTDGGVTWVNVWKGNFYNFGNGTEWRNPINNHFFGVNSGASNTANASGTWADFVINGCSGSDPLCGTVLYALQNTVYGLQVNQSESGTFAAYGVMCNYCEENTLKGIKWYGSGAGFGAANDLGGIHLNHAYYTDFDADCFSGFGPCVSLVSSLKNILEPLLASDNGASGTYSYALTADSSSSIDVTNMKANDDRGTPYQKGISVASGGVVIVNGQQYYATAATPDSGVYDVIGLISAFTNNYFSNILAGGTFIWAVNNVEQMGLSTSGLLVVPPLTIGGGAAISNSNAVPQVGTAVANQAVCFVSVGPPAVIGHCTSVVGAGGACTCAP